jgi:carbon-monoxide dehydrogenase medium subunit
LIPAQVAYVRASSLEEAFDALADPEAKVLAGGHSLLPVMKLRIARPSLLVDIGGLALGGVELRNGELRLGALATWDDLARASELSPPALAAIAECAGVIGDLQVRNRGTLGGSLAHGDPASDMPAVLLALGAALALRSSEGDRTVMAAEFFQGPFTTALSSHELIAGIVVPMPPAGSGSAYVKVEHPASGFALAGAAALVRPDGSPTIAVTGVGSQPFLLSDGTEPIAALAQADIYGDRFASEEYRRHLAGVVVRRALERAEVRAKEAS